MSSEKLDSVEKGDDNTVVRTSFDEGRTTELHPNATQISYRFAHHQKEHEQGDIALKYAHNSHEGQEVPPDVRRRLAFKADAYLFTFMGWCYCLQFADKTVINGTSVLGIRDDLDMKGAMYSWVGSSFYLGYLVGVMPMVFILQRYPVSKVISICYFSWAVVLTVSSASQNYAGLVATRVILGILESVVTPAFTIITTQWFPRRSHFSRICLWFGFNGLGTVLATALALGFYNLSVSTTMSMDSWRALMLTMGLITLVTSVVFYFHVPDTPVQAWFLSEEERAWQVQVIREHNGSAGYGTRTIKMYQVWEALYDPATWLAGFYIFLSDVPNGASTNFNTIILEGLGFTKIPDSLKMTLVGGGAEFVGCWLTGILSMFVFKNTRQVYCVLCNAIAVLCYCLLAWGPNPGSQLFGNYASNWAAPVGMIAFLSNIGSNSGGFTKKLVTNGLFLALYSAGNIVGPQTFKGSEEPNYPTGKKSMAATMAASLGMNVLLVMLNIWRNWRRDKKDEKLPPEIENPEFADLTDFENPEFRYAM